MKAVDVPQENKQVWLVKAVDVIFLCNIFGSYLGLGSLVCMILPPVTVVDSIVLLLLLPLIAPFILLFNTIIGLLLLASKIKYGTLPVFNAPHAYFAHGRVNTAIFFIGNALLYYLSIKFMDAVLGMDL